ncbi:MAG: shikimate dehydrogenase [Bacteroidales bacterium]|jgi:shikimate dehydrogenase|nr:shikimate dehydrogenase [Bacteroidales bacterium]MDX9926119.1 shikimate dehydrogenase [Bacteroidales bacterium]HNX83600.1 shikimate dehydrogenase [Bacteroidales bacterium]HOC47964.1 shikimate dehydrogenase [Bacteroidales bacterium]HPS96821.1 shikimate dehydrogenase [Bacteroidales bacterium]
MRLYGIIGFPLGHSFSQKHFSEKFEREHLSDHAYRKFELPEIGMLPELLVREPDLCGFNVTIPWKVKVMDFLDDIDPVAAEIGAVNTVKVTRHGGKAWLKGFNTDAPAFRESLLSNLDTLPDSALVLGTGGAAKSVIHTLIDLNIIAVPVSRKPVRGGYTYDDLPGYMISEAGVIINTTPVGMAPHTEAMPPIDYSCLREGQLLFDLIYNPPVTAFLSRGEEHGCITVNGEEMFLIQAGLAWEIWNDVE